LILSLLIWCILLYSLYIGLKRPYVFALLYLWLDFFRPQIVAPKGFEGTDVTIVIGLLAVVGLIVNAPSRIIRPGFDFLLLIFLAGWITLTTFTAVVQPGAWVKWDWAFKGLVFAALLGQFTQRREEFEAAVLVMIAASLHQILSYAIKTAFGGGGYQIDLGVLGYMTVGLGESSTLAVFCACILPIVAAFARHSIIIPNGRLRSWGSGALMLCCILAPIGTFARTALLSVSLSVLGLAFRRRAALIAVLVSGMLVIIALPIIAESSWAQRMSSTFTYSRDTSAMGRVAVWLWTIDYVKDNPLGGGFFIDQTNQFAVDIDGNDGSDGGQLEIRGKAFHSIYFEVLGEQGWPGFMLYFWIVLLSIFRLFRVWRGTRSMPGMEWEHEMAYAFLVGWAALLVGAAFVGIAWLPMMFLMMAFSNCIFRFYTEKVDVAFLPAGILARKSADENLYNTKSS
jgi:putative inorganic carbon (HCO3(-)) transporter